MEKEEIYQKHKRLILSIAKKYLQRVKSLTLDDLIDEGVLGLFKAAEKYDPEKNCKFSTYAVFWIKQYINKAVINNDPIIRISAKMILDIGKYARTKAKLNQELKREPLIEEIAATMNITVKKVQSIEKIILHRPKSISLESPVGKDDEKNPLLKFIGDKRIKSPEDLTYERNIEEGIEKNLNPQERMVVNLIFGIDDGVPHTLNEVGKKLHLTRERIRQIRKKAIEKMRKKEKL